MYVYVCVHLSAKSLQSCLTLCDPMDYSLPGSSVHGILQARILEWVTISFSRGSCWPRDWTHVSYISCIADRFLTFWAAREAHTHIHTTEQREPRSDFYASLLDIMHYFIFLCFTYSILFNSCKVKVLVSQLYPTFCDPMDCSLPDSSVYVMEPNLRTWKTLLCMFLTPTWAFPFFCSVFLHLLLPAFFFWDHSFLSSCNIYLFS